ncbi:MAG: AAA family ATPase [Dehalococcoidia bacterium]|nr:AAA family ATPase [Dehalococcoidia bacterium]
MQKRAYPHAVSNIELIQTHISYVFLAGDQVYKLKKPVDLGFLDFSTLEKRREACEAESRLNQRGCPGGVYVGVEQLKQHHGAFRIGGEGETVDYLVHMKRLPRERMMDRMLERGEVDFEMIARVAARLAELHRSAERGEKIAELGGFGQQVRNWRENLMQLHPLVGRTLGGARLERIERFVDGFMHAEADLLRRREKDGWIRDCHGDLRSDAVCFDPSLPGGICLFDCIEFNDAFRYSDTGLDAAFLAMDLDYRGHPDLSNLFISLYAHAVGDKELAVLLPLFKCHRATIRGKVESFQLVDPAIGARQKAAARRRARKYFALADSYTRGHGRQALILVTGPSGSGKSVLAGVLAAHLSAVLLSTDIIRREHFQDRGRDAPIDAGIYSPEARASVYDELYREAEEMLAQGRSVVLDGTYIERNQRLPVERLAGQLRARLLLVECSAPDEVVRDRQRRREGEAWTASEGRWDVYLAQKARIEPVTEVPDSRRITIDTTLPIAEQIEAIRAKLKGR